MSTPVSVIIPTYYRNELVREAIESVLEQEYDPIELVVVDDSGEGHAKPVIDSYDDVNGVIREENGGWGRAYTTGIEASTGEYIQFLDDDDYLLPGRISKTAAVLDDNPDVGVAYSGLKQDDKGFQYPVPEVSGNILERALRFKTYPCFTGTMLMERDILTDLTPLPVLPAGNDLNLMIELARRTKFDYVDECLVYRRAGESMMWTGLNKFEGMKRVVARQSEIYDEYPSIRRAVLAERYEEEGQARLAKDPWSALAVLCFLKATYYADDTRLRCAVQVLASLFGRPGLNTARRVRDLAAGRSRPNSSDPA